MAKYVSFLYVANFVRKYVKSVLKPQGSIMTSTGLSPWVVEVAHGETLDHRD